MIIPYVGLIVFPKWNDEYNANSYTFLALKTKRFRDQLLWMCFYMTYSLLCVHSKWRFQNKHAH